MGTSWVARMRGIVGAWSAGIAALAGAGARGDGPDAPGKNGPPPIELRPAAEYRAELEVLLEKDQPGAGANAWDGLRDAVRAMREVQDWDDAVIAANPDVAMDEIPSFAADEIRFGAFDLGVWTTGRTYLDRMERQGVWAAIDRAGAAPRRVPPFLWGADTDPNGISQVQAEWNRIRPIGIGLVSAMRVAHHDRDEDRVIAMVARHRIIAEVLGGSPEPTMWIKAPLQCTLVCREVCQEIMEHPYSDRLLKRVDAEIARLDPGSSPRVWLEAVPIAERFEAAADPRAYRGSAGDPSIVIPILDAVVSVYETQLEMPASKRDRPGDGFSNRLMEVMARTYDLGDDLSARGRLIPVADRIEGIVQLTLDQYSGAQVMAAGTRAVIAVERYRLATGALPEDLDALVPEFLASVPIDPMTGKAMCYRRVQGDAHGRAYLVYSTGIDGVDDGGREPKGDQYPDPSNIEKGFDCVVNVPRRSVQ